MANTMMKYDVEASLKIRMVVETTETDRRQVRPIAREIVQTLINKYQAMDGEELDTRVTEWSLDIYDNFADAHPWEPEEFGRPCECFNCGWKGGEDQLNEIRDLGSRIEAGDTAVPAGECPECGCLAYLDKADEELPDNVGLNDALTPEWPVEMQWTDEPVGPPPILPPDFTDEEKADMKHNAQMLEGCETEDEFNAELRAQTQGR